MKKIIILLALLILKPSFSFAGQSWKFICYNQSDCSYEFARLVNMLNDRRGYEGPLTVYFDSQVIKLDGRNWLLDNLDYPLTFEGAGQYATRFEFSNNGAITFEGSHAPLTLKDMSFEKAGTSAPVIVQGQSLTVQNSRFKNYQDTSSQKYFGPCIDFKRFSNGLRYNFKAQNNTFQQCSRGIYINGANSVELSDNTFDFLKMTSAKYISGVAINGFTNYTFDGNHFYAHLTSGEAYIKAIQPVGNATGTIANNYFESQQATDSIYTSHHYVNLDSNYFFYNSAVESRPNEKRIVLRYAPYSLKYNVTRAKQGLRGTAHASQCNSSNYNLCITN